MDAQQAHQIAAAASQIDVGSFYGSSDGLAPGAGVIIDNVEFPIFDDAEGRFAVKSGLVYVVTHECDIDADNNRALNDLAVVCPVTPMQDFVAAFAELGEEKLAQVLDALGGRGISRAVYLPPMAAVLPYGGLLYLNALSHTHRSKLHNDEAKAVGCVTWKGLREIDFALEQHLRRPKADRLPLTVMRSELN